MTRHRNDSRRFATNVSLGILLGGAAIATIALANRWMERTRVDQLAILGAVVLDSADIAQAAKIDRDVAMSEVDLESVENRVAAHPFVTDAAVYRASNGRIVIEVSERTPAASLIMEGRPYYVDQRGVILPYRFGVASADVPVLTGCAAGLTVDSAAVRRALRVATVIRRYGGIVAANVSEIICRDDNQFSLRLTDQRGEILLGKLTTVESTLPKLEAFLLRLIPQRSESSFRYADLRWRGQVVVSWTKELNDENNTI